MQLYKFYPAGMIEKFSHSTFFILNLIGAIAKLLHRIGAKSKITAFGGFPLRIASPFSILPFGYHYLGS